MQELKDDEMKLNGNFSEKQRARHRESKRRQRLRDKGLLDDGTQELFQCRLCLAIQVPGDEFTSIKTKHISIALEDIFHMNVSKEDRNLLKRICPSCKSLLTMFYTFYSKVLRCQKILETQKPQDVVNTNGIKPDQKLPTLNPFAIQKQKVEVKKDYIPEIKAQSDKSKEQDLFDKSHDSSFEDQSSKDDLIEEDDDDVLDDEKSPEDSSDLIDLDFDYTDEENNSGDFDETERDEPNGCDLEKASKVTIKQETKAVDEEKTVEEVQPIQKEDEKIDVKKIALPEPELSEVQKQDLIEDNGLESEIDCTVIDKKAVVAAVNLSEKKPVFTEKKQIKSVVSEKKKTKSVKSENSIKKTRKRKRSIEVKENKPMKDKKTSPIKDDTTIDDSVHELQDDTIDDSVQELDKTDTSPIPPAPKRKRLSRIGVFPCKNCNKIYNRRGNVIKHLLKCGIEKKTKEPKPPKSPKKSKSTPEKNLDTTLNVTIETPETTPIIKKESKVVSETKKRRSLQKKHICQMCHAIFYDQEEFQNHLVDCSLNDDTN